VCNDIGNDHVNCVVVYGLNALNVATVVKICRRINCVIFQTITHTRDNYLIVIFMTCDNILVETSLSRVSILTMPKYIISNGACLEQYGLDLRYYMTSVNMTFLKYWQYLRPRYAFCRPHRKIVF